MKMKFKNLERKLRKLGTDILLPLALGTFVIGGFGARLYYSSPNYKYNIGQNDKIINMRRSEAVGFPVIKETFGIDRGSDGKIEEYFDYYSAFGGKAAGYSYSALRNFP